MRQRGCEYRAHRRLVERGAEKGGQLRSGLGPETIEVFGGLGQRFAMAYAQHAIKALSSQAHGQFT